MARPCERDHRLGKKGCAVCTLCLENSENGRTCRRLWGVPEPSFPGMFERGVNFLGAAASHFAAGMPSLSEADKQARLAVCEAPCDMYVAEKKSCRHPKCGCNLEIKAGWADQDCPMGKWPKLNEIWPKRFDETNLAVGFPGIRFNSSIIRYRDHYLLAYRNGFSGSDIFLVRLSRDFKPFGDAVPLGLFHPTQANYGREDPRLFYHNDQLHIAYVGVVGQPGDSIDRLHTSVLYARLNESNLKVERVFYPEFTHRQSWEKSWSMFSHSGKLHCVYSIDPHVILRIDDNKAEAVCQTNTPSVWQDGIRRGGATPVLCGDQFYHFFHSRVEEGGQRVYRMGVYTFENKPPFRVIRQSRYPLLVADTNTKPSGWYASVVYPCGAILDGDNWIVSMGVHDRWTELHRFPRNYIEERLGV